MKYENLKYFSIYLLFTVTVISFGCSESDDNQIQYDDESNNDQYTQSAEASEDEPTDDLGLYYRPGVMTIKISIKQEGSFSKQISTPKESAQSSNMKWNFDLEATSTRDLWVTHDLSNPLIFNNANPETDSKDSAYSYGPYSFGNDNQSTEVITSHMKYTLQFDSKTPNALDIISIEKSIKGIGKIEEIKIDNMRLSQYGFGYEFDILIKRNMHFNNHETIIFRNRTVTNDTETTDIEPFKFHLFPVPDVKAVAEYPYSSSEIQSNYPKSAIEQVAQFNDIYTGNVTIMQNYFVGLIEKSSKDSLTITFHNTGEKWLPFIPFFETYGIRPKTEIMISINFSKA